MKNFDVDFKFFTECGIGYRGGYNMEDNWLELYVANIWKDTHNFNDFIDGLCVVQLTEFLCAIHRDLNADIEPFCLNHFAASGLNCIHFNKAKEILNSKYRMIP